jgi:hypothetical protein
MDYEKSFYNINKNNNNSFHNLYLLLVTTYEYYNRKF